MADAPQSMGFLFQSRFMTKHYSQPRPVWERLILVESPDETSKRSAMVITLRQSALRPNNTMCMCMHVESTSMVWASRSSSSSIVSNLSAPLLLTRCRVGEGL